uniref:Uncharacterized protein n=1 Tax=Arundo donax TaxID=35708 RepID=A0A0A9AFF9_ARUDO
MFSTKLCLLREKGVSFSLQL